MPIVVHFRASDMPAHFHVTRRSGLDYPDRVKTVSKLGALEHLGLALSEKRRFHQIVRKHLEGCGELKEPLEPDGMRPRQVRYQAAATPPTFLPT